MIELPIWAIILLVLCGAVIGFLFDWWIEATR